MTSIVVVAIIVIITEIELIIAAVGVKWKLQQFPWEPARWNHKDSEEDIKLVLYINVCSP